MPASRDVSPANAGISGPPYGSPMRRRCWYIRLRSLISTPLLLEFRRGPELDPAELAGKTRPSDAGLSGQAALDAVLGKLRTIRHWCSRARPAICRPRWVRWEGKAFLLQGGDCAESLPNSIRQYPRHLRVLLQMRWC